LNFGQIILADRT